MFRRGFTLVELLIVMAMLGIMAAIVLPKFASASETGKSQTMSSSVRGVRQLIGVHRQKRDVPLAVSGWPATIEADWFMGNRMPMHSWSERAMIINTVTSGANDFYPATKTYDVSSATAATAWYNTTNGAFCALVPSTMTGARAISAFNDANIAGITTLAQTTR